MADSTCDRCETNEFVETVIDHMDNGGMPIQLCEECLENEILCDLPCTRCDMPMIGEGLFTNKKTKCFCLGCTTHLANMIDECIQSTPHMRYVLFPDDEILTKSYDNFDMKDCDTCSSVHAVSKDDSSTFSVRDGVSNHRSETCYFDDDNMDTIDFLNEVSDDPKYAILHEFIDGYYDYLVKNDLLLK